MCSTHFYCAQTELGQRWTVELFITIMFLFDTFICIGLYSVRHYSLILKSKTPGVWFEMHTCYICLLYFKLSLNREECFLLARAKCLLTFTIARILSLWKEDSCSRDIKSRQAVTFLHTCGCFSAWPLISVVYFRLALVPTVPYTVSLCLHLTNCALSHNTPSAFNYCLKVSGLRVTHSTGSLLGSVSAACVHGWRLQFDV